MRIHKRMSISQGVDSPIQISKFDNIKLFILLSFMYIAI